ncbi:MAG TPA: ATP-binding cassette domain-containing protein [Arachnia sp.]|mgnify:CR=1 FL=1|nr:ATP-binding cassette domain-containing protein [Arachnia sp.]HMT84977.1 ATP-binding cassette domain-containing protein [Arachnia sp.]
MFTWTTTVSGDSAESVSSIRRMTSAKTDSTVETRNSHMVASLHSVSYSYGRGTALDQVSFAIPDGITGLLGPDGAGKSTLMRLLATLELPTSGVVVVLGQATSSRWGRTCIRRRSGYLAQQFPLAKRKRILDSVAYSGWVNGLSRDEAFDSAVAALDAVGLSGIGNQRCRALSGAERQRLGVAMAISHRPDFLILDEPTAGLDPEARTDLRAVLKDIAASTSVLLSTHLVDDIVHLADQVVVLDKGKLLFSGPVLELERGVVAIEEDGFATPLERSYVSLLRRNRS